MLKINPNNNEKDKMPSKSNAHIFREVVGGIILLAVGGYLLLYTPYDWGGGIMIFCGVVCIMG